MTTPAVLYLLETLKSSQETYEVTDPVEMSFVRQDCCFLTVSSPEEDQCIREMTHYRLTHINYTLVSVTLDSRQASVHQFYHPFRSKASLVRIAPMVYRLESGTTGPFWEYRDGSEVKIGSGIRRLRRSIPQFVS
jgi:hypothetical protein